MYENIVILQGGCTQCPICRRKIKWSYKLELKNNIILESGFGIPSFLQVSPSGQINHIATSDGKIRFNIYCKVCGSNIETEPMELVNKENYEKNIENA